MTIFASNTTATVIITASITTTTANMMGGLLLMGSNQIWKVQRIEKILKIQMIWKIYISFARYRQQPGWKEEDIDFSFMVIFVTEISPQGVLADEFTPILIDLMETGMKQVNTPV